MREDQANAERYGSMREQYRRAGVRVLQLGQPPIADEPRQGTSKLLSFKEKVQKLKALVRKEDVHVLDVHLAPANPICAAATLGTGIPFVVTLYQLNTVQSAKLWLAGQFNLGSAALLITDSNAQASKFRKWLLRRREIRVIPNGTQPPQPVLTREHMLRVLTIPDEPNLTIIGQISSLVPYKGHLVLLRAAKQVLECHHVTGAWNYLLKVRLRNTKELESFLSGTIKAVHGVERTETLITLSSAKETWTLDPAP